MAGLAALIFAALAVVGLATAFLTGSGRALSFGLADVVIALVSFCIWAWSL